MNVCSMNSCSEIVTKKKKSVLGWTQLKLTWNSALLHGCILFHMEGYTT